MRHVLGFGLAIVMAVAVFFAGSWGYLRLLRTPVPGGAARALPAAGGSLLHDRNVLLAFAALAAVALLAGLLAVVPRVSPLAAGLPGLLFVAWTAAYGVRVREAVRYIPLKNDAFGHGFEAMLFNGVLAAAGIVMIIPLFVPSRWRRRRAVGFGYAPNGYGYGYGDQADAAPDDTTVSLLADYSDTAPYPRPGSPPRL
jgi:hypothetical protein